MAAVAAAAAAAPNKPKNEFFFARKSFVLKKLREAKICKFYIERNL